MTEEIRVCWKCGYKCVASQLQKTGGRCPKTSCNVILDSDLNTKLKALGAPNA